MRLGAGAKEYLYPEVDAKHKFLYTAGTLYELMPNGIYTKAEDGIRDLVRSRGLGDVYKRQFDHKVLSNLLFL